MIATLKESKARLSELVRLAGAGEDVLITVRGKPQARLSAVRSPKSGNDSWMDELRKLRAGTRKMSGSSSVLDDIRSDRL
jgi:prevent-host-death family protein